MNPKDKKQIIQNYLDAYNQFDIEGMLAVLSDDIQFENIQDNEVNTSTDGKAEFEALARQSVTLFTERQQTVESIEESPEKVTVNISFYAKLASDLPNGLKAGDELKLEGVSEFIFSGDLICSIRDIS